MYKFSVTILMAMGLAGFIEVEAEEGSPNAIKLRQEVRDVTGVDLAALARPEPKIDLRQRIIDKFKPLMEQAQLSNSTSSEDAGSAASSPKATAYSSQALAASGFLERNLTTQGGMVTGKFYHIGDDICHIRADEDYMLMRVNIDFVMSVIDVNSITMKSTDSTDWLNVDSVQGKIFKFSRYNGNSDQWSSWNTAIAASFIATPSNQQNIMKALDVLAVECGAPEGF